MRRARGDLALDAVLMFVVCVRWHRDNVQLVRISAGPAPGARGPGLGSALLFHLLLLL